MARIALIDLIPIAKMFPLQRNQTSKTTGQSSQTVTTKGDGVGGSYSAGPLSSFGRASVAPFRGHASGGYCPPHGAVAEVVTYTADGQRTVTDVPISVDDRRQPLGPEVVVVSDGRATTYGPQTSVTLGGGDYTAPTPWAVTGPWTPSGPWTAPPMAPAVTPAVTPAAATAIVPPSSSLPSPSKTTTTPTLFTHPPQRNSITGNLTCILLFEI